jgi:hypothetical protein
VVVEQPRLELALNADEGNRSVGYVGTFQFLEDLGPFVMPAKVFVLVRPGGPLIPEDDDPIASSVEEIPGGKFTAFEESEFIGHRDDREMDLDPGPKLEKFTNPPANVDFQPVRPALDEDTHSRHHASLARRPMV